MPGQHEPTPKRLSEARRRGHLPVSLNLAAAGVMGLCVLVLPAWGQHLVSRWSADTIRLLQHLGEPDVSHVQPLLEDVLSLLLPLLIVLVAMFIALAVVQTRLNLSADAFANPRFRGLPSARAMLERSAQLLTSGVVLLALWWSLKLLLQRLPIAIGDPNNVAWSVSQLRNSILSGLGAAGTFIALELWLRRWLHRRALSMSHSELLHEAKEQQSPETVRRRQREHQKALTQQRTFQASEHTHRLWDHGTRRTVDLAWWPETGLPPFLASKGETSVPPHAALVVLDAPELTRSLYRADVGFPIPEGLWDDCAEVLTAPRR